MELSDGEKLVRFDTSSQEYGTLTASWLVCYAGSVVSNRMLLRCPSVQAKTILASLSAGIGRAIHIP